MAKQRSELLVGLTWLLLTLSVRGWEQSSPFQGVSGQWSDVNDTQLSSFYRSGYGGDYDSSDFGGDDYSSGESVVTEVGDATDFALGQRGFQVDSMDVTLKEWPVAKQSPGEFKITCSEAGFKVTMPNGPSEVQVLGPTAFLSVLDVPESCGYDVSPFNNTMTVPFSGCHVKLHDGHYTLQLLYTNELGQPSLATESCESSPQLVDSNLQLPRSSAPSKNSKCPKPKGCVYPKEERVPCGQKGIAAAKCREIGCCVDFTTQACYYPMNQCTADKHFVFAIRHNTASIKVDTTKLGFPGYPNCKPVIANDKFAVFKSSLTDCGARSYEVGGTKIYLLELQTGIQALNLKYGIITRDSAVRFMIECRYTTKDSGTQFASTGYMVKNPSYNFPSKVTSNGLFGVTLRIAKDQTYSSYFPTYHRPLQLLLGQPVYLELSLRAPKPDAVVLVNYCLAYPRSAKNALVLVYEGCTNPSDPNVSIFQVSGLPTNRYQRRLVVKAFQFMDQQTNKYLDEEIYFMCSTEVCQPTEKTCRESCFDGKAP